MPKLFHSEWHLDFWYYQNFHYSSSLDYHYAFYHQDVPLHHAYECLRAARDRAQVRHNTRDLLFSGSIFILPLKAFNCTRSSGLSSLLADSFFLLYYLPIEIYSLNKRYNQYFYYCFLHQFVTQYSHCRVIQ